MALFIVTRPGVYNDRIPPCEGASSREGKRRDRRTFTSPEEHDAKLKGDPWMARGFDHGFWSEGERSGIERYFPSSQWVIEIDDMQAFVIREGGVKIDLPEVEGGECTITLGDA